MILLRGSRCVCALAVLGLAVAFPAASAMAQSNENDNKTPEAKRPPTTSETIYLKNITSVSDLNDIQTALRNNFPYVKVYGAASQNAVTVRGTTDELAAVKKMVTELDRPRKVYKLTYTVTESDAGKRTAVQHFSVIVAEGSKTTLKQGDRVPLVTGVTTQSANSSPNSQFQYIDVGLNIDASIDGVSLKTKIEQTAVAEEKNIMGVQEPVIRQTMLEALSTLQSGKPVSLGSMDEPGTTRHQEIEVSAELLTK